MKQRINILKKIKDKSLSWLAKKKREYSVNIVINETEDITTNSTGKKKKNYKSMMKNYILINLIT